MRGLCVPFRCSVFLTRKWLRIRNRKTAGLFGLGARASVANLLTTRRPLAKASTQQVRQASMQKLNRARTGTNNDTRTHIQTRAHANTYTQTRKPLSTHDQSVEQARNHATNNSTNTPPRARNHNTRTHGRTTTPRSHNHVNGDTRAQLRSNAKC